MIDMNQPDWFYKIIEETEHKSRVNNVIDIRQYLLRMHKILQRHDNMFKGETFTVAKIILNTLKQIINFHVGYVVGNPVSLNGDSDIVKVFNRIYKKGHYNKIDYEVVDSLYKYGNAFEYVYLDSSTDRIKSKIIANEDSYPVYDEMYKYVAFVEHWEDLDSVKHFIVYTNDSVSTYEGTTLIDTHVNLTGLPIHYCSLDKSEYQHFGDGLMNDLIPIMDNIEKLLSKLFDAIETLSLNPIGVSSGQQIEGSINKDFVGAVLNLEVGAEFSYASATMDYNNIKLLLDNLIQHLYLVAGVPSSVMGQGNIANVSEVSLKLLYSNSDNKAKQTIQVLREGMYLRFEYFNKLLGIIKGYESFGEDVFDSLDVMFATNRPVDTINMLKELQIQYEMNAISRESIIEISPYTNDVAHEMERINKETREPNVT